MWQCCAILALLSVYIVRVDAQPDPDSSCCTFYVAPLGRDANHGTIEEPWRTIGKANNELNAGDTVLIRGGDYDEVIEPRNSGAPGSPITYRSYPGETVTIRGEAEKQALVSIGWGVNGNWNPKSYIIIDDFTLTYDHFPVPRWTSWVRIAGSQSHHNQIINNTFIRPGNVQANFESGIRDLGINLHQGTHHNLIARNSIKGLSGIGIRVEGSATHNIVTNNKIVETAKSAIDINGGDYEISGMLIENNMLGESLIADGIQFECDYERDCKDDDSNQGVVIRNNHIFNNAENAIDLKGAARIVIEGNIIYGNQGNNSGGLGSDEGANRLGGGAIMRGSGSRSRDVIVRRNVIYDNRAPAVLLEKGYKVYKNTIIGNNRDYTGPNSKYQSRRKPVFVGLTLWSGRYERIGVKNNIIGNHGSAELVLKTNVSHDADINHNLYFADPNLKFADFRKKYDWDQMSFRQWKSRLRLLSGIKGHDTESVVADPMFVNVPIRPVGASDQFEFSLKAVSPAIDSGGFLTRAVQAGKGAALRVADAGYFFDGFGIVKGDSIQLEDQTRTANVIAVDYSANILKLDRPLEWSKGQGVSLAFHGSAPDIGVHEHTE